MKNVINFFYNFNIDNIRMVGNNYCFKYQNNNFIFYEIKKRYFDYKIALELNSLLLKNSSAFYRIIPNKNNSILTYHSNKKYVLMLDNLKQDKNFDYFDILDTNIPITDNINIQNKENKFSWNILWKNKIDYFEMFVNYNVNKYGELEDYYNYFIGMAENAILYFEDTINTTYPNDNDRMVISHQRITEDYTLKQLYNPMELIVDHPSRDLSEYLKMIFFSQKRDMNEISLYINESIFSSYGARMLLCRMMFPSFFFDLFEKLVDNKVKYKALIYMIDNMNKYEEYVFDIYKIIKEKYDIPEIKWLKKIDYSSTLTTPNTSGISFINIDSMPSLSVTSIMLQ